MFGQHNRALEKTRMCREHPHCNGRNRGCDLFAHHEDEVRCRDYATTGSCTLHTMGRCNLKHIRAEEVLVTKHCAQEMQRVAELADGGGGDEYVSEGRRPDMVSTVFLNVLKHYPPPAHIEALRAVARLDGDKAKLRTIFVQLRRETAKYIERNEGDRLDSVERFHAFNRVLLDCEDVQNANDMRLYDIRAADIERVEMRSGPALFKIHVEGLAEKRPSVIRGDEIRAVEMVPGANGHYRVHRGYAFFVNMSDVYVSFNNAQIDIYEQYDVIFTFPRTQIRAMHRALEQCTFVPQRRVNSLVPRLTVAQSASARRLNQEQTSFVRQAMHGTHNAYILWGPPGTGKTTTLVATLHETLVASSTTPWRILLCAPSNEAAMHMTEGVHKFLEADPVLHDKTRLMHVFAASKDPKEVQDTIAARYAVKGYSEDGKPCYVLPQAHELQGTSRNLVVVCTLSMSGKLYALFPKHDRLIFDRVFIDEAAQALYPQMLLPLCMAATDRTTVLLFGDEKQLGPQVRSAPAAAKGLATSALEVWRTSPLFRDTFTEGANVVMLQENYRSHVDILSCFNHAYDGRLQAKAAHAHAPGPHVTLIHVDGREEKEADSPSLMNRDEIRAVLQVLYDVLASGTAIKDVVVLAPYIKQVKKLQGHLHHMLTQGYGQDAGLDRLARLLHQQYGAAYDRKTYPLKVCTVESFQGQERDTVILTTVRSRGADGELEADIQRQLGFLRQPRRVNVALSRAKKMMYIVGNGNVLSRDAFWANALAKVTDVRNNDPRLPFRRSAPRAPLPRGDAVMAAAASPTDEDEAEFGRERPFMATEE